MTGRGNREASLVDGGEEKVEKEGKEVFSRGTLTLFLQQLAIWSYRHTASKTGGLTGHTTRALAKYVLRTASN